MVEYVLNIYTRYNVTLWTLKVLILVQFLEFYF